MFAGNVKWAKVTCEDVTLLGGEMLDRRWVRDVYAFDWSETPPAMDFDYERNRGKLLDAEVAYQSARAEYGNSSGPFVDCVIRHDTVRR